MKKYFVLFLFIMFSFCGVKALNASYIKCVDGDTADFKINGNVKKVRFLAVDTPEIKHGKREADPYGDEAKNFTCNILKNAKHIRLEYDDASDKTDKYGRVLAWVFVDNNLLQEDLIKNGYAKVAYIYGDYKYTDSLKKLEAKAKKNKLNIWGEYEEDYSKYFYLLILGVMVIVICIFDKSFRKKTVNKVKRKAKKEISREISKFLK